MMPTDVAELESELQFIGHELARAVGAGGRDRLHRTEDQRARVNVYQRDSGFDGKDRQGACIAGTVPSAHHTDWPLLLLPP